MQIVRPYHLKSLEKKSLHNILGQLYDLHKLSHHRKKHIKLTDSLIGSVDFDAISILYI